MPDSPEPRESLSVSAVLYYCKCKILRPYLRLLAVMGLRPLDTQELSTWVQMLWYLYTIQVVLFIFCGYILQYMTCFRRDRGFCYEIKLEYSQEAESEIYTLVCNGNLVFSFIIPAVIHFIAYLYAVFLLKVSNNENLSSLMERVRKYLRFFFNWQVAETV